MWFLLCFPYEGNIVIIDQLSFFFFGSSNGNVRYVGNDEIPYENVGVGLFKDSSLMRTFSLQPPNAILINMILVSIYPWIIPTLDEIDSFGDSMTLSPLEQGYQELSCL